MSCFLAFLKNLSSIKIKNILNNKRLEYKIDTGKRIKIEKATVKAMISLYCKSHHNPYHSPGIFLCDDCGELIKYAFLKLEKCPYGEKKPPCSKCTVHCYSDDMRTKIKAVMKYSGPRMLYNHPFLAARYLLVKIRSR